MTIETLRVMARAFSKISIRALGRPAVEQPPEEPGEDEEEESEDEGEEEDVLPDEETPCILSAVREYSRMKPRTQRIWLDATGLLDYPLPDWDDQVHVMRSVRIEDRNNRRFIDERDWQVYQAEDGTWKLRLVESYQNGKLILEFIGPHEVNENSSTIPESDQEALAHLAASYLLTAAANNYAKNSSSTISGDAVSQSEQSKAYSFQAKDELAIWERFLEQTRTNRSKRVNWDLSRTEHNGLGRFWNRRGRIGLW